MDEFVERLSSNQRTLTARNMVLYVSYYNDSNPARQAELDRCLAHNQSNPLFRRIVIFDETSNLINFNNVVVVPTASRMTFSDFFRYANENDDNDDTIHVLINSDIIIGEGFEDIRLESDQAFCLSRHELRENGTSSIDIGGGSHDAWVWRGKIRDGMGEFYMGKMLCDGVLANQLADKGYCLKNPAKGLYVYHYHLTQLRNYGWHDAIRGRRRGITMTQHDHIFSLDDLYEDGWN
jgi:hypothetical protein